MPDSVTVISLGGSIIAPDGRGYRRSSRAFHRLVEERLAADPRLKLIIVCGGGGLARDYQAALREVMPGRRAARTWTGSGVAATRVNGELLRRVLHAWCVEDLVTDPTAVVRVRRADPGRGGMEAGLLHRQRRGRARPALLGGDGDQPVQHREGVLGRSEEEPGRATHGHAVVEGNAARSSGSEWTPGKNTPFDPTAARAAAQSGIRVIFAEGRNLDNLAQILAGREFVGTTIGPE